MSRLGWDRWWIGAPFSVRPSHAASDITASIGSSCDLGPLAPPWPWERECEVRTLERVHFLAERRANLVTDDVPLEALVQACRLLEAIEARQAELARWIS